MHECWGGVPERTACEKTKAGAVKHPREGEAVPNGACGAPGGRCMTAIMPAQAREPEQKASAGGAVRDAATWAAAQLGNGAFAAIEDARAAVRRCPGVCNAHPSQKRGGSRDPAFAGAEAAEPGPLPDVRHDACGWVCNRPAGPDFHAACAKDRHSACVSSSRFFVNHHPILSGLSTKVFRISPRAAGPTLPSCFPA